MPGRPNNRFDNRPEAERGGARRISAWGLYQTVQGTWQTYAEMMNLAGRAASAPWYATEAEYVGVVETLYNGLWHEARYDPALYVAAFHAHPAAAREYQRTGFLDSPHEAYIRRAAGQSTSLWAYPSTSSVGDPPRFGVASRGDFPW